VILLDYLSDKKVKIRKPQKCWGCGREFPKGSILRYIKNVDGGVFSSVYWCDTCQEYWDEYMESDDECSMGELRREDAERWEETRKQIEG
jgi:hypothetical protein